MLDTPSEAAEALKVRIILTEIFQSWAFGLFHKAELSCGTAAYQMFVTANLNWLDVLKLDHISLINDRRAKNFASVSRCVTHQKSRNSKWISWRTYRSKIKQTKGDRKYRGLGQSYLGHCPSKEEDHHCKSEWIPTSICERRCNQKRVRHTNDSMTEQRWALRIDLVYDNLSGQMQLWCNLHGPLERAVT